MSPFQIGEGETQIEVSIVFEEPYPSQHYVIVAMCNHPDFYVVLKTQREDMAFLEVVRRQAEAESFGFLSWIAVGLESGAV
ncbi:WIAG-tail domain [Paenibacillus sp.]|uniref:WIAG-tail domain n=1 Tax=Paenibacillus sp. TaxID=58172 RepID=UPI00283AAED2|nr:WIAG-tail domain [Paenibacillus sp.]